MTTPDGAVGVESAKVHALDCPRCGERIEEGFGSMSRWDSDTEVCAACGTEETMLQAEAAATDTFNVIRCVHPTQGAVRWAIFRHRSIRTR